MTHKSHTDLALRILIAMAAGLCAGLVIKHASGAAPFLQTWIVDGVFQTAGQLFIAALKMIVVPLVFVSLVCGTASLGTTARLGRMSIKTICLYVCTTAIAVSLGLGIAAIIQPGVGAPLRQADYVPRSAPSAVDIFSALIPENPVAALAEGNMLQVIVFAVLIGVSAAMAGNPGKRVAAFFDDLNSVIMKLVTIVIQIAPLGVFCLMAKLFARFGLDIFAGLISYVAVVFVVLMIHAALTYPALLYFGAGLDPRTFYRKMKSAMLFGFSTASSNATLPVTMETATGHLGVRNKIASFTLPLGATINMDGTAIMQGVATVYIAGVYSVDLTVTMYATIIVMATVASIGTAGVPSAGLIMLVMVLQQVGLPAEGIAIIIGVDRVLDMVRTAVNIAGDCAVSCVVARSEAEFDRELFDDTSAAF